MMQAFNRLIHIFLLSTLPFYSLCQTDLQIGNSIQMERNGIIFSFKEPKGWEKSSQSFSADQSNLLASYINRNLNSAIQLYITPIPEKFKQSYEKFFDNEENIEKFVNQTYPQPINKISEYDLIYINETPLIKLIFHVDISNNIKDSPYYKPLKEKGYSDQQIIELSTQKTLSLITFQRGNMINFGCSAVINNFDELLPFFSKINQTIKIK